MSLLKLIVIHWFLYASVKWLTGPEIEKMVVSIEGDFSNLLSQADQGVEQTKDKLGELDNAGQKAGKGLKGSAAIAGVAFGLAATAATKLLDIVLQLAVAVPQFFAKLARRAVELNEEFETITVTLTNLFGGNQQAALSFMDALKKRALELGIEFKGAAQFAKSLLPEAGDLETFDRLLAVVAQAAADTGRSVEELIFTFNELASGDLTSAREILDLPKPVRDAIKEANFDLKETITILEALFKKRGIDLESFGNTFTRVKAKIRAFGDDILLLAGGPIKDELAASAQFFLDTLNKNAPAIRAFALGVGELIGKLLELGRTQVFERLIDWIARTGVAAGRFSKIAAGFYVSFYEPIIRYGAFVLKFFDDLLLSIPLVGEAVEFLRGMWSRLDEALITAAQIVAFAKAAIDGLTAALGPVARLVKTVSESILAFVSGDFATASAKADEAMAIIRDGLIDMDAAAEAAKESLLESAKTIAGIGDEADKLDDPILPDLGADNMADELEAAKAMLGDLALELADLQEETNARLAELQADHQEKMAKIEADGVEKRLEINEKFDNELAKLAKETEDKRLKIIAKAQDDLAKLRSDTDQKLAESSADFDQDELRRTEDHLREMRRLEDQFLFDLQDAVRERDARAIVDLERRFAMESQRKEEDFNVDSGRREEDQSQELAEIRQHETERRNEILASQAQELEELRLAEETKRLELETRRRDDLEKLDASLIEKRNKEMTNYQERQADLEQALQKRLEAIVKNLADENEVTAEGAQKILETLMEYFGIGGEIDQLMEQFATRRRIRADIEVKFESSPDAPPPVFGGTLPGTNLVPVPAFQHGGSMVATKPTLALFGEGGPEIATFTPVSELSQVTRNESSRDFNFNISLEGAPPGMDQRQMEDALSGVILRALRDSGALSEA